MSDGDHTNYDLLLPFDTDDKEFARGVEVGIVWARTAEGEYDFTVHASNAEMMLRISEARELRVRAEQVDDRWIHVSFSDAGGG